MLGGDVTEERLKELVRRGVLEYAIDPTTAYMKAGVRVWFPLDEIQDLLEDE